MASRKEEKERLRLERLEREKAAQASAGRRKRLGMIVAGVIAAAALAAVVAVALGGGDDGGGGNGGGNGGSTYPEGVEVPAREVRDLQDAAKAAGCRLSEPRSEGANHTETDEATVRYRSNPPTSGDHNPTPAGDGAKDEPAKTEQLVHSLEHGRVIFQFADDAPPRVRGALKTVFDEDPAIAILTQNDTNMPYQVAATAWDKLLACPRYNDKVPDALRAFREENRLKGPEFVPNPE